MLPRTPGNDTRMLELIRASNRYNPKRGLSSGVHSRKVRNSPAKPAKPMMVMNIRAAAGIGCALGPSAGLLSAGMPVSEDFSLVVAAGMGNRAYWSYRQMQ